MAAAPARATPSVDQEPARSSGDHPCARSPSDASDTSVRVVAELAALTAIFDDAVNVVALRRALALELGDEARRAVAEPSFRALFQVAVGAQTQRRIATELSSLPHLAADLGLWVEVLADLTGCECVGVRLIRVEEAMCPRFHVDRVALRVVCTYLGLGTEYVASEHVERRLLGHAAGGRPDEGSGLLLAPGRTLAASPGDVVLLKGEVWPGNAGRGAVHRSPLASRQAPRLVMTLDPL